MQEEEIRNTQLILLTTTIIIEHQIQGCSWEEIKRHLLKLLPNVRLHQSITTAINPKICINKNNTIFNLSTLTHTTYQLYPQNNLSIKYLEGEIG